MISITPIIFLLSQTPTTALPENPTLDGIGPFGQHRPVPELPNGLATSRALLGTIIDLAADDTTGHTIPLMNSNICEVDNSFLVNCPNVNEDVPVPDGALKTSVPLATFIRVEAAPLEKCLASTDRSPWVEIDVELRSQDETTTSKTITARIAAPHWTPVLLGAKVSLQNGDWATHVNVSVNPIGWQQDTLLVDCAVRLKVWPNYPDISISNGSALINSLTNEIRLKERLLRYAEVIVGALPAIQLLESQIDTLLQQLATSTNAELMASADEWIAALEAAYFALFGETDAETEMAILDLIDIISAVKAGSWFTDSGGFMTVEDVLGENDKLLLSAFVDMATEAAAEATQDIETLPGELANLNSDKEVSRQLFYDYIFDRHEFWNGKITLDGHPWVFYWFELIPIPMFTHRWGVSSLDIYGDILNHSRVRLHGTLEKSTVDPYSYEVLGE